MMTAVERVAIMRAARDAQRAGKDSTDCPYDITSNDADQATRAAAWIRSFVLTRTLAAESPVA